MENSIGRRRFLSGGAVAGAAALGATAVSVAKQAQADELPEIKWHLTSGLTHCWQGDVKTARGDVAQARGWIDRYGTVTWLDALEAWLHTEIAWAGRNWFDAEQAVARMVGLATQVEHEQLACMGHMLSRASIHRRWPKCGCCGGASSASARSRSRAGRVW